MPWIFRSSGLASLALAIHGWFVGKAIIGVDLAPYARTQDARLDPVPSRPHRRRRRHRCTPGRHHHHAGRSPARHRAHHHRLPRHHHRRSAGHGRRRPGPSQWPSVAVLAAGQLLYGLAMGMSNSREMSYRRLITPDDLQARTSTTMRSLNRAVMVLVAPLADVAADAWGMRPTLLIAALVFGLVAVGLAASPDGPASSSPMTDDCRNSARRWRRHVHRTSR